MQIFLEQTKKNAQLNCFKFIFKKVKIVKNSLEIFYIFTINMVYNNLLKSVNFQ